MHDLFLSSRGNNINKPVQCSAIITQSIFSQMFTKDALYIAYPSRRGMGRLLWALPLIDILLDLLQLFMQYRTMLDRVLTALNCICLAGDLGTKSHQPITESFVIKDISREH